MAVNTGMMHRSRLLHRLFINHLNTTHISASSSSVVSSVMALHKIDLQFEQRASADQPSPSGDNSATRLTSDRSNKRTYDDQQRSNRKTPTAQLPLNSELHSLDKIAIDTAGWGKLAPRKPTTPRDSQGRFIPATITVASPISSVSSISASALSTLQNSPFGSPRENTIESPITSPDPNPLETFKYPAPIIDDDMSNTAVKLFAGDDDSKDDNPQDFINSIERSFLGRTSLSEDQKLRHFQLCLKAGSVAKAWWNDLDGSTQKDSWDHLLIAFEERWPEKIIAAKTTEEKVAALTAATLSETAPGTKVIINGVEEMAHVAWADKLERLAKAVPDSANLLLPATIKKMPKALKTVIGTNFKTWKEFCEAVRDASVPGIKDAQEDQEELRAMKETIQRMEQADKSGKSIRDIMRTVTFNQPTTAIRPTTPLTPNSSIIPNQIRPIQSFRPEADRYVDVTTKALQQHPNTPAGRELYERQISDWTSKHGTAGPTELRPYPLTPGTTPVASGECWKCGRPGHVAWIAPNHKSQP
ncbi:hypothetical protein BD779DRAFT_1805952 [Infundibulicybe gibba]|nr:hypothetical protein BD779DRAFT_1805952 [Infundibulicybe gibba]